jgi:hypothetical protein
MLFPLIYLLLNMKWGNKSAKLPCLEPPVEVVSSHEMPARIPIEHLTTAKSETRVRNRHATRRYREKRKREAATRQLETVARKTEMQKQYAELAGVGQMSFEVCLCYCLCSKVRQAQSEFCEECSTLHQAI